MSAAVESLATARTAIEMIAEASSEPAIKRLASRALASLDALARQDLERRMREAERKRTGRVRGRPPDIQDRPRPSADATGHPRTLGVGGRSTQRSVGEDTLSDFSQIREGEIARERPRTSADTDGAASEDIRGQSGLPEERAVPLGAQMPDGYRAVAQLATVQDIDGAWAKFVGHYAGQVIHVAGRWQKWCVTEAKHERMERERARAASAPRPKPEDPPGLVEHRRRQDEAARRRRDDYDRQAVPMPAGILETVRAVTAGAPSPAAPVAESTMEPERQEETDDDLPF